MPWTRASSLERSLLCPVSTILPTFDEKSQLARDAAEWGTLAHAWADTGIVPESRYGPLLERQIEVSGIDRGGLWLEAGRVPPFCFAINCDPQNGLPRFLKFWAPSQETRNAWKESHPECYVTGEMDYARVVGPVGWVDDLKTGRVQDPNCDQVSLYCLALYFDHDCQLNVVERSITHWPRPNLYAAKPRSFKKPMRYYGDESSAAWLEQYYETLQVAYRERELIAFEPDPEEYATPGDHCWYCPARMFCPKGNEANGF